MRMAGFRQRECCPDERSSARQDGGLVQRLVHRQISSNLRNEMANSIRTGPNLLHRGKIKFEMTRITSSTILVALFTQHDFVDESDERRVSGRHPRHIAASDKLL